MLSFHSNMVIVTSVWFFTTIYVARLCVKSPSGSVGLPAAFLFSMTFLYAGAFTYAVPGYTHLRSGAHWYLDGFGVDHQSILQGAIVTCLAVVSFAVGVRAQTARTREQNVSVLSRHSNDFGRRVSLLALGAFALMGFLTPALGIQIPLGQAIAKVGQNASVALICIGFFWSQVDNKKSVTALSYAAAGLIPVYYLIVWGFVSHGFIISTVFACFLLGTSTRRKWPIHKIALVTLFFGYFAITFFVIYISFRDEIREVVWGGASYGSRFSVVFGLLSEIKLLSPYDFESLDLINARLSQTSFVGRVIDWHFNYPELRQYGGTFVLLLFAWVPRFLWPGKPAMGSSEILENNSGLFFSESSTFGAGPVIEFYANFGIIGVLLGFFLFGCIVSWLDGKAIAELRQGRFLSFAKYFTVGLAFIAPLSDIFFFANTAIISWIIVGGMQILLAGRIFKAQ